ncbi:MAG: (2Fe-2S)-binding protein [Candidatus Krumholzibacteria bacterium]|nr:(2Fe-2S)-binding protein [Candidatus Krumholzibacteria bacterium]
MIVRFTLNGEEVDADIVPATRLVDLLRGAFELTGTKVGCEEGECGACTVIVDGEAINSCLYLAADVEGKEVVTIEGLGEDGVLDEVERVFVESGAVQCGFCTPGMIMRTCVFLRENENPSEEDIRRSIEGNICRCTGYVKIIDAIKTLVAARIGAGK